MRIILSLLTLTISIALAAQNKPCDGRVSGAIRDINSGDPLPFATVKIQNSDQGVISDKNGEFIITQICEDEVHLEVRFLGYKTVIHHHDFHHSDPVIYMASDETLLESVIVEESRSEQLETVSIQKKEISKLAMMNTSMGELASEISGVSILKTGSNISKPMIHGLHSNRVLVVNDGIRHAYQVWGQEHAPEIDPSHVDQIEIVKGAGTVKYGPEALGGVILYSSKRPTFDKALNGSFGSSFQTNGRAVSSQVNLGKGSHRFAWNVGAFGTYQGDLQAPDYNLSNTGKREYGVSFNTLLHKPKFDLQVSGSYFDQKLGILRASIVGNLQDLQNAINDSLPQPTFARTYDLQNPRQITGHGILKSELSYFHGDHVFNFQYAIQRNAREEFDIRRGELNDRPVIDLTMYSHTLETEWIQPSKNGWSGSSGIQLFTQNSANEPGSNPVNFVPDYNVFNVGAFTVQSLDFDNTTVELGARFDFQSLNVADEIRESFSYENNVDYTNSNFTLGIKKELNNSLSIFSNIGTAWRPPNVAEIYSFGYHNSRLQFGLWRYNFDLPIPTPPDSVFDQSLREIPAERGVKWITGLEVKRKKATAEFIIYTNKINDYIFLRPYGITTGIAGTFPYFIFEQTDAFLVGSDWDIRIDHSSQFDSELKLSYVYALSTERNQALLDIPPFNVNYSIHYNIGFWKYALNFNYTATQWNAPSVIEPAQINDGNIELDINNDIFDFMSPPDDYLLISADVSYSRKKWIASFSSNNLLNTSYRIYTDRLRYFADAPGRNFSFSIEYKF